MNAPYLKNTNHKNSNFIIDKDYIDVLSTLVDMDNLNILLIGNNGSVKLL